mmetsp:Transcript_47298/g.94818  ORF Transcript_47298/g.94818 Transcript_47298/m.94818 type:complete len:192 (+) Transcript_47298:496-1071(+)
MLAIANRQSEDPDLDYSVYDQVSRIYRWDGSQLSEFQSLGDEFRTAIGSPSSFSNSNTSVADIEAKFCGFFGCGVGEDGQTQSVPFLRGTTTFKFFVDDGESYLLVAQSVYERDMSREQCTASNVASCEICLTSTAPSTRRAPWTTWRSSSSRRSSASSASRRTGQNVESRSKRACAVLVLVFMLVAVDSK